MEKLKSNAQWGIAFSIVCLALAIVYFAVQVHDFLTGFPEILVQMEKTAVEIGPVVNDIAETSRNIVPISENIDHVATVAPSVVKEVAAVRQDLPGLLAQTAGVLEALDQTTRLLPDVLDEMRQTRTLVPDMLEELHRSRQVIAEATQTMNQIDARVPEIITATENIRNDLPVVLQTLDTAAASVQSFSAQMETFRPLVPQILEEMRKTRHAVPDMLDQAERITRQGQKFGSDASKGVVSGLFSFLNPIVLTRQLKDFVLPGKDVQGLTSQDIEKIRETTVLVVEGIPGEPMLKWHNPESGNYGRSTVVRQFEEDAAACKEIRTEIWIEKDKSHDFTLIFCQQEDGAWIKKE